MKREIQLALKDIIDGLEWNVGEPLFESVVVNYRDEDDEEKPESEKPDSGCIISLQTGNFSERALRKGLDEVTGTGFLAMLWKQTCNDFIDKYETGPEMIVEAILQDRTLGGKVKDIYPLSINWNLYRTEGIGVFMMAELQFRLKTRFYINRE